MPREDTDPSGESRSSVFTMGQGNRLEYCFRIFGLRDVAELGRLLTLVDDPAVASNLRFVSDPPRGTPAVWSALALMAAARQVAEDVDSCLGMRRRLVGFKAFWNSRGEGDGGMGEGAAPAAADGDIISATTAAAAESSARRMSSRPEMAIVDIWN